jgi:hypothetical protein
VVIYLDMLLQVLRSLKSFSAELTFVWLEGDVYSNVGGYMITFHCAGVAPFPATDEIQVVGALSSDVPLTKMLLRDDH